jgi:hypothetical protein
LRLAFRGLSLDSKAENHCGNYHYLTHTYLPFTVRRLRC